MLRLIRIRKWRVPNALAVAAALLLLASSLASVERPDNPTDSAAAMAGAHSEAVTTQESAPAPLAQAPLKQARKFRVNLFLFRH